MKLLESTSSIFVPECVGSKYLEFKPEKNDYFLISTVAWDRVTTSIYQIDFGGALFYIPSGMFILISDETGETDWLMVDEIIGRDITVPIISNNLKRHRVYSPKLSGVFTGQYYWPMTKGIIPVTNEMYTIILSNRCQYLKTKHMHIEDFLV